MKRIILTVLLICSTVASAQQYLTREARLSFDAGSPLEDIEAFTESGSAVFDASSGKIGVQALMTSFQFKRALMQEHFNENYVESEKFPKASFKGTYAEGEVKGAHCPSTALRRKSAVPASLNEGERELRLRPLHLTSFLAEYNVKIPSAVADKISKTASIQVQARPLKRVGK